MIISSFRLLTPLLGLVSLRRRYLPRRGRSCRRENIWLTSWKKKWLRNNSPSKRRYSHSYLLFVPIIKHMAPFAQRVNSLYVTQVRLLPKKQKKSEVFLPKSSFHFCLRQKKVHLPLYCGCIGVWLSSILWDSCTSMTEQVQNMSGHLKCTQTSECFSVLEDFPMAFTWFFSSHCNTHLGCVQSTPGLPQCALHTYFTDVVDSKCKIPTLEWKS